MCAWAEETTEDGGRVVGIDFGGVGCCDGAGFGGRFECCGAFGGLAGS